MGPRGTLPRMLAGGGGMKSLGGGAPSVVPGWRAATDEDEHYVYAMAL